MVSSNLHHPGERKTVPADAGARFQDVYASQEQTKWCWAACAHMACAQLNISPAPKQCEIASKQLSRDCCSSPQPCNVAYPMSEIEKLYTQLGIRCRGIERPIEEARLMEEIFADRPVQIGYTYHGAIHGHVVLIIGEHNGRRNGKKYLRVADPAVEDGPRSRMFEEVRSDRGRGTWVWTWIDMRKAETP